VDLQLGQGRKQQYQRLRDQINLCQGAHLVLTQLTQATSKAGPIGSRVKCLRSFRLDQGENFLKLKQDVKKIHVILPTYLSSQFT
jgi:hypothetical protein